MIRRRGVPQTHQQLNRPGLALHLSVMLVSVDYSKRGFPLSTSLSVGHQSSAADSFVLVKQFKLESITTP